MLRSKKIVENNWVLLCANRSWLILVHDFNLSCYNE